MSRPRTVSRAIVGVGLALALAAPAATPVDVPNADFTLREADGSLRGWTTEGHPAGLRWTPAQSGTTAILVCPRLDRSRWTALESSPLPLDPWHRYRLTVTWRGGLFYQWSVMLRYRLPGGAQFDYPVFPTRYGLAPAPGWSRRPFEFIVPSNAAESRLVLHVKGEGDQGYRPALRSVQLVDLGPEPLEGEPPGPRPPRRVSAEELDRLGGGRGYLRRDGAGRHLLNQAGATVSGAGVVVSRIWARGEGTLYLTARMDAAGKGRFFDFRGPPWDLTGEWTEYHWELPILFTAVERTRAGIVADIQATGTIELDEPAAWAIQSTRPAPVSRPHQATPNLSEDEP